MNAVSPSPKAAYGSRDLARVEALIARLQGEIAELELLIRHLGLTDRDSTDLQDDLHLRIDDLAEAIEKRICLIADG